MATTAGPLSGTRLKQYRMLEQIGEGGMGVVYRAHDERLQRDVAVKVLVRGALGDAEAQKRAREEALTLSKLNHPNIETIFDFDQQDGVDFVVLEYVPGVSLDAKIAGAPLPEREIMELGAQLAHGLAAAHEQGILHCDLKPGNLRVTPDGRLKILDFGLARAAHPAPDVGGMRTTATGNYGTLPYMAPEHLRAHALDARSDLWSAGCVLYEMATGRPPFHGETAPVLSAAILTEDPPAPRSLNPKLSPALEMLILKCLEKDSAARYQTAKELAGDLKRLGNMSSSFVPVAAPRRPSWMIFASIAAVAILLLAVFNLPLRWSKEAPAAAPGAIQSIAVLPLENLSHDPQQEYFADGMTDELITNLSNIDDLRVISRTSAMSYRNSPKPLPQIARELHVDAVVEGSVLWSGNRVRISAQLVDARLDRTLWSDAYERDLSDVLELQSEVAHAVANGIRVKLSAKAEARLTPRMVNADAYQAYLKGRYYWNKRTEADMNRALALFQQAIAKQPDYAQAYAAIADCYAVLGAYGLIPSSRANPLEKEAAEKAVSLDEDLAEAHAALGSYLADTWDWNGSLAEYQRALELNPNYATAAQWYAETLMNVGRAEDSLRQSRRAQQSDPLSLVVNSVVGYMNYRAHRYPEAIASLRKTLELDPGFYRSHLYLAEALEGSGDYPGAIAELQKCLSLPGGNIAEARSELAHVYGVSGQQDKARAILRELEHPPRGEFVDPFYLAVVYDGLGEREAALHFLQKAYEIHSKALTFQVHDPRLEGMRADPRFLDLLRRMNFPQ